MKLGNPNSYPFDSYQTFIVIMASILPDNDDLPLTVFTLGAVQGFTYTTQFQGTSEGSVVVVSFDIRRSATTRIFAAIIFIRECARRYSTSESPPRTDRNAQLCGFLVSAFSLLRCQSGSEARTPNFLWLPSQLPCSLLCPIYETVSPASLLQLELQKIVS